MEIELYVYLQDDTDDVGDFRTFTFGATSTVHDLRKQILAAFHIPLQHQQVYLVRAETETKKETREQLRGGTLQKANVTNESKIVVKHADLQWWPQYKKSVEIAMKSSGRERMLNAQEAVRLHMRLMESGFFDVYTSFNSFRMENQHEVTYWADGNLILMKKAVKSHFRAQHYKLKDAKDESDFICRFESRPTDLGGTRKNTLAFVRLHGEMEETKYNVKCHHFGSRAWSNSGKGQPPDIKELYCYKLLELIDVGPHSQFILPKKVVDSKTSMYIATEWHDDFVPISRIKEEKDVSVEILVQLLLLGAFLFIDDLHPDNCGQWKDTKDAAIVDFMPKAYATYTNVKRVLLNNVLGSYSSMYWEAVHIDALEKCDEKTRLEMAKKYLKKWDLLSKIDMANEQIKPEKDRMKEKGLDFKGFNSPTEELDQYISAIKQNLEKLAEMLNAGE